MKNRTLLALLFFTQLTSHAQQAASLPAITVAVSANKTNFLYGTKTIKREGEVSKQNGDFLRFTGQASIEWTIDVASAGLYEINVTYGLQSDSAEAQQIEIVAGQKSFVNTLEPTWGAFGKGSYERILMKDQVQLQAGIQSLSLKTPAALLKNGKPINLRSIDLTPVAAKAAIEFEIADAKKQRASTDWMTRAGYGLMFHWTSQSVNRDGTQKAYQQAVADFDLKAFTAMVETTGAGYVILTIGHAEPFCPAPIKSWENYHPGHTTKRDLIGEMADALGLKGIKLICYLPTHVIAKKDKVSEKEFTEININIMTELGNRYGKKIAGYWFDGWYQCFEEYPGFSFRNFFEACKAGYRDRVIALNSWIYPPVTQWQEYWAGETASPVELPVSGTLERGPGKGLRYQALLIMEPYWVQEKAEMPNPRFTAEKLADYIKQCNARGGSVTINLGIYQDGTVGDKALDVMKEVRKRVKPY